MIPEEGSGEGRGTEQGGGPGLTASYHPSALYLYQTSDALSHSVLPVRSPTSRGNIPPPRPLPTPLLGETHVKRQSSWCLWLPSRRWRLRRETILAGFESLCRLCGHVGALCWERSCPAADSTGPHSGRTDQKTGRGWPRRAEDQGNQGHENLESPPFPSQIKTKGQEISKEGKHMGGGKVTPDEE